MSADTRHPLTPDVAVDQLEQLYSSATGELAEALDTFLRNRTLPSPAARARFRYPLLRVRYSADAEPRPTTLPAPSVA